MRKKTVKNRKKVSKAILATYGENIYEGKKAYFILRDLQ